MKKLLAAASAALFAVVLLASVRTAFASSAIGLTVMNTGAEAVPSVNVTIDSRDVTLRSGMRGKEYSVTPSSDGIAVIDVRCTRFRGVSAAEIDRTSGLTDVAQLVTLTKAGASEKLRLSVKAGNTYYFALYSRSAGSSFSVRAALYPYGGKRLAIGRQYGVALAPDSGYCDYTFTAVKTGAVDIALSAKDTEGDGSSVATAIFCGGKKLLHNALGDTFPTFCGVEGKKTYTLRIYASSLGNERVPMLVDIKINLVKTGVGSSSRKSAAVLKKSAGCTGFLLGNGDVRWYRLNVARPHKVKIRYYSYSNDNAQKLALYKGGSRLAVRNISNDDGSSCFKYVFTRRLKKGVYYIRLKNGGGATGRYFLSWK